MVLNPIEPNWARAALLTIDMQNDFALPAGAGFVPGTDAIVPAFARLVGAFREHSMPIFHAARLYLEDGSNAERCRQQGRPYPTLTADGKLASNPVNDVSTVSQ